MAAGAETGQYSDGATVGAIAGLTTGDGGDRLTVQLDRGRLQAGFIGGPSTEMGNVRPLILFHQRLRVEEGGHYFAIGQHHIAGIHVGRFGGGEMLKLWQGNVVDFARNRNAVCGDFINCWVPAIGSGMEAVARGGGGGLDELGRLQVLVIGLATEGRTTDEDAFGCSGVRRCHGFTVNGKGKRGITGRS